jgi:hypothetical protein
MQRNKEDLSRQKDISPLGSRKLDVKMSILPKLISNFNAIPIKTNSFICTKDELI